MPSRIIVTAPGCARRCCAAESVPEGGIVQPCGVCCLRTIDTNTRRVGEIPGCVPPKGVGAGLYSTKIENGRVKFMTTRPLNYEVSIEPQDPLYPPTKPVF